MSLQRALLVLIATALFAGIVPAGLVIDRRLAREVETRARDDLAQAPRLLADRNLAQAEVMLMHAKDVARASGLVEALARGDRKTAVRAAELARDGFGDGSVVVAATGDVWSGPKPGAAVFDSVRRGATPTTVIADSGALHLVTLVPVVRGTTWLGAVGISVVMSRSTAGVLAALTRSDVLILGAHGRLVATTATDSIAALLAPQAAGIPRDGQVRMVMLGTQQFLFAAVPAGDVSATVFVRDLARDLAVLPVFRRLVVLSGIAAVLIGLVLGTIVAQRIARPVRALADAADRLAAGDVDAPLMHSSIREVDRLSDAFGAMRRALSLRISDVTGANVRLADRQARFETSQSEILQRERLAVSSRLVAELSHEIRNPIANLRNCLEIIRRRVQDDPQGREFTDLAIDELLRMHELAEQLLDLNRPRDPGIRVAHVDSVMHEVARLTSAGWPPGVLELEITHVAGSDAIAAIAPDALKQVLLNLVQNAREALGAQSPVTGAASAPTAGSGGRITIAAHAASGRLFIEVSDNGPGIAPDVLPRVFDPFFTTKGAVHGVGLGLFVAEGLVRTAGGRIAVANRMEGGVTFHIELLLVEPAVATTDGLMQHAHATVRPTAVVQAGRS